MNGIRQATYALRVVRRRGGDAAIVYRRRVNLRHEERFDRIAAISPVAFTAGAGLLKPAIRALAGNSAKRPPTGPFHPLDADWGARTASYTLVAAGLRNASRLHTAAENLRRADGVEAACWFGLLEGSHRKRAVRALRILVEDGQNLFHSMRSAFGHTYPNYDVAALASAVCAPKAGSRIRCVSIPACPIRPTMPGGVASVRPSCCT